MNIAPEEMPREIARLEDENERLHSIIKEVREYIEDNTYKSNGTEYMDLTGIKELLEILKGE